MGGYLSADQALENASTDRVEKDVEDVFGGKVRIRSLSAAVSARVKQATIQMGGKSTTLDFPTAERLQFKEGVIEPQFSIEQVKKLQIESGPSFAKVISEIDLISGLDKEALRKAQEEFPQSGDDGQ